MTNKPMLSVERELLKKWHRDLDACQRVIWLAGGFDPAYCKDAQDCLKEMDEALAKLATPHQGESAAYVQFLADVMTAAGLVAHGKQDKKFAERLADECARLQVEHFALPVAAANSIPAYEAPETGEKWSLTGDNGSWDYDSLDELLKDNYGHDSDGDGHPASYRAGLYEGGTVYRGTECKDDPATFLPDQDDLLEHMSERAYDSDAGEWADNYPALDSDAKLELERAMRPLKAWARKHCQPEFFTIKDITPHIVTVEDVSRSRKS